MNMGNSMQISIKKDIDTTINTVEEEYDKQSLIKIKGKVVEQIEKQIEERVEERIEKQIETDRHNVNNWLQYCNSW